jgi:pentatricopeptide repeat protein
MQKNQIHYGLRTNKTHHGWQEGFAAMAPGTVQLNILGWNKKLRKYMKDGQAQKAMQLVRQIQQEGMSPHTFTFVQLCLMHVLV